MYFETRNSSALGGKGEEHDAFLSDHEINSINQLMEIYVNHDCSLQEVLRLLNSLSNNENSFHFNLNTDIQRLLISRYPKKMTFSGPNDIFEQEKNNSFNQSIIIAEGNMFKGTDYEKDQLANVKVILDNRIGKQLVGTYGQLSFIDINSEHHAYELIKKFLARYQPSEHAILQSGSLLGVSNLAHEIALERGFETIGIIPRSIDHIVNKSKFSYVIVEGDDWGEASYLFGGLPDDILFAGGGYWSYLEYKKALEYGINISFCAFQGVRYVEEFDDHTTKRVIF